MAILHTIGLIPRPLSELAHLVSQQFEIIALAAIGMRVKFKDLAAEGPKALGYGLTIGACQILFAIVLIKLLLDNFYYIKEESYMYDILIIGGGPAGISAAIYAKSRGCNV